MRSRIPRASLLLVASAAVLVCSTSCVASVDAAGSTGRKKNDEGQAISGSASASDAASASLLRGADPNAGSSTSTALAPITVRGGAENAKPGSSSGGRRHRQLGSTFGQTGGGSIASVIQGLLSVLDKTEVGSGNGCKPTRPCRLCEGDCDADEDCGGVMRCYHREYPFTAVPGCTGAEWRDDTTDFCYMPPEDAGPPLVENDCEDLGGGACGMCQGDCDSDWDCAGRLRCYQRNYELTAVPGCYGGELLYNREDFCYLPPPPAKNEIYLPDDGCSTNRPCAKCRGECDSDDHCQGNLRCMARPNRYQSVPGCLGGDFLEDTVGICYDPRDDDKVKTVGDCTADDPCGWCAGDCDTDDDCAPGLICYQRALPYEDVPGCKGGMDDKSSADYCVNPIDVDTHTTVSMPAMSGRNNDADDWDDFVTYNFDLKDTDLGPIGWEDLDASDNEWQTYGEPSTSSNECDGDTQSPIDLTFANDICEETHHIYYFPGDIDEYNAAGAIEYAIDPFRLRINFDKAFDGFIPPGIDPPGGIAGGITQKDASHAELLMPSEHAIGGRKFEAEYRIFHAEDNYDTIIGVAVMISTDTDTHNPFMEVLLQKWEKVAECGNGRGYIDQNMGWKEIYNMVRSMYFWAYEGSLTTPPCSEIVQWRVIDTAVQISKDQLERLRVLLREGGPCGNHPQRRTLGPNGGTRPLQRDSSNSRVWRCTSDDYMWRE